MVPSRTLVAPGLRTAPKPGWRADLVAAGAAPLSRPYLWLIGIIGFALRGGIVLLTLPIIVLPTQVEVRLALGGNLGSTGLTPGFWSIVAGVTALTVAGALLVLYVLARLELAAFSRLMNDPISAEQRGWVEPRKLDTRRRRVITIELFVVQALALLAILVAAVPLAAAVGDAALGEILRPSSTDSIYVRILGQVTAPLAWLVVALIVIEAISAVATRAVLLSAFGLRSTIAAGSAHRAPRAALDALVRHPLRIALVGAFGWLLFAGALVAGVWAIGIAWQAAKSVFLAGGSIDALAQAAGFLIVAILLAGVFVAALLAGGFVSAVRAGLWSLTALR